MSSTRCHERPSDRLARSSEPSFSITNARHASTPPVKRMNRGGRCRRTNSAQSRRTGAPPGTVGASGTSKKRTYWAPHASFSLRISRSYALRRNMLHQYSMAGARMYLAGSVSFHSFQSRVMGASPTYMFRRVR